MYGELGLGQLEGEREGGVLADCVQAVLKRGEEGAGGYVVE